MGTAAGGSRRVAFTFAFVFALALVGVRMNRAHDDMAEAVLEDAVDAYSPEPVAAGDTGPGAVMPETAAGGDSTEAPSTHKSKGTFCDDDDDATDDTDCVPVEYCDTDDTNSAPVDCVPEETPAACDWCADECATDGVNHPHIKQLTCEYCQGACVIFTYKPTACPTAGAASHTRRPSATPTRGPTQPTGMPTPAPSALATAGAPAPRPTLPFFSLEVELRLDGVDASAFENSDYVSAFKQTAADVLGLRLDAIQDMAAIATSRRRLRDSALFDCAVTFDVVVRDASNVSTIYAYESDVHAALKRSMSDGVFTTELATYANATGNAAALSKARSTSVVAVFVFLITSEPPTTYYAPSYAPSSYVVREATVRRSESWEKRTRRFFAATILWIPIYGWCVAVSLLACIFCVFAWLSAEATVEWLPARKSRAVKHPWWVEEDYGGRSSAFVLKRETIAGAESRSRLAGSRAEQYSLLHS